MHIFSFLPTVCIMRYSTVVGFLVRFDFSFILRLKILARAWAASSVTSVTGRFVFCSINPNGILSVLLLLSRTSVVGVQRTSASLPVLGLQVKVSTTQPSTSFSESATSRQPHLIQALTEWSASFSVASASPFGSTPSAHK